MLPTKLVTGQLFKQGVVKKINQIIDYLKTQRILSDNKTIKTNQYSAGIGLQVISQSTCGTGSSGDGDSYPFQLSIQHQRNESGVILSSALHIQDGYIQIFSDHFDGCLVNEYNKQYNGVDLTEIEDIGSYYALLMIEYYPDQTDDPEVNQNIFYPTVLFAEADSIDSLSGIPQFPGLYTTLLGKIDVDYNDDDEEYIYQVSSFLRGDNMFNFEADHQYAITPTLPDIENGTLIEEPFALEDYSFRVNDGLLKWHGTYFAFNHQDIDIADDEKNHVYISFEPNTSGTLSAFTSNQVLRRYDLDEGRYNIQIGQINYTSAGLQIKQYVKDQISLDQNMVSVATYDQIPDYLQNKFEFSQPRWQLPACSGIFGSYILTSVVTGATSSEFTNAQLGLTMLWDNIAGYEPMITQQQQDQPQYLCHYYNKTLGVQTIGWHTGLSGGGGSTSGEYNFNVSGSLADFITITTQKQGDKTNVKLTFKPQSIDPQPDKDIILIKDDEGNLTYKTGTNVMYYFDDQGILTTFDLRTDGIVYIQDGVPHVLNNGAGIVMTDSAGIPYIQSLDDLEGLLRVTDQGQLTSIGPNTSDDVQILASNEGYIYWENTVECEQQSQE